MEGSPTPSNDAAWFYFGVFIAATVILFTIYCTFYFKKKTDTGPRTECRREDGDFRFTPIPGENVDIENQYGIVVISTGKQARCYHKANCEIVTNPRRRGNFCERKPCKYCFKNKRAGSGSDSE